MTRLLVLVLAALNLLFFSWSRWIDGNDAHLVDVAAPSLPAATVAPAAPPPCATLGPFSEGLMALQAKEKLEAGGMTVQRRAASEALHEGWWVHVGNGDADKQARTLNTIKRAGINDAFAMPDDPEFKVSVGIFSTEERAQDRAAKVQRLKLDAAVTERIRTQSVIWYDMAGVAPDTLRDGRLTRAGVALDRLRIEACPAATPAAPARAGADIIPPP